MEFLMNRISIYWKYSWQIAVNSIGLFHQTGQLLLINTTDAQNWPKGSVLPVRENTSEETTVGP